MMMVLYKTAATIVGLLTLFCSAQDTLEPLEITNNTIGETGVLRFSYTPRGITTAYTVQWFYRPLNSSETPQLVYFRRHTPSVTVSYLHLIGRSYHEHTDETTSLFIENLRLNDSGHYSCRFAELNDITNVTTLRPKNLVLRSEFTLIPGGVLITVLEGEPFSATVQTPWSVPVFDIEFDPADNPISTSTQERDFYYQRNSTFTIPIANMSHDGMNIMAQASRTGQVEFNFLFTVDVIPTTAPPLTTAPPPPPSNDTKSFCTHYSTRPYCIIIIVIPIFFLGGCSVAIIVIFICRKKNKEVVLKLIDEIRKKCKEYRGKDTCFCILKVSPSILRTQVWIEVIPADGVTATNEMLDSFVKETAFTISLSRKQVQSILDGTMTVPELIELLPLDLPDDIINILKRLLEFI